MIKSIYTKHNSLYVPHSQLSDQSKRSIALESKTLLDNSSKSSIREEIWSEFFESNPFIFSEALPIKFDSLFSQVRLDTGRPDFVFHRQAQNPLFSTTGIIEIKRPDSRILDVYGTHLSLSRSANRAVAQIKDYTDGLRNGEFITNKGTLALGNSRAAFIIIGMSEEVTNKLYSEVLLGKFAEVLPAGVQLLTYDYLFEQFKAGIELPIVFILADEQHESGKWAVDPEGYLIDISQWNDKFITASATEDDLELTDAHYEVIYFLREYSGTKFLSYR